MQRLWVTVRMLAVTLGVMEGMRMLLAEEGRGLIFFLFFFLTDIDFLYYIYLYYINT